MKKNIIQQISETMENECKKDFAIHMVLLRVILRKANSCIGHCWWLSGLIAHNCPDWWILSVHSIRVDYCL